MTDEQKHELIVRYTDGTLPDDEMAILSDMLKRDADAREFLRSLAEQAVEMADLERSAAERAMVGKGSRRPTLPSRKGHSRKIVPLDLLKWALPLAAILILLLSFVMGSLNTGSARPAVAYIRDMGTAIEWTGPDGQLVHDLKPGDSLPSGTDVQTLADDGWLWLVLRDGSEVIVTAQSKLTAFEDGNGQVHIRFSEGNLWGVPKGAPLPVSTSTAEFTGTNGVFHIETCQTMSLLRVYDGVVGTVRSSDGAATRVESNQQVTVSSTNPRRLIAMEQPEPVNFWHCGMLESPQAVMGDWARPVGSEHARLRATPHRYKKDDGSSMMLYVTKFNVASSGSPAVMLEPSSVLRVRGRTSGAAKIRFGVVTQKLRGLYTGKYRTIVDTELDRDETGAWSLELPVAEMRLLDKNQHFTKSPIGSELNSIIVYTVDENVDLEVHRVELLPAPASASASASEPVTPVNPVDRTSDR